LRNDAGLVIHCNTVSVSAPPNTHTSEVITWG
jgi:hypothetical protein